MDGVPRDHINIKVLQTMVSRTPPYLGPWNQNSESLCFCGLRVPSYQHPALRALTLPTPLNVPLLPGPQGYVHYCPVELLLEALGHYFAYFWGPDKNPSGLCFVVLGNPGYSLVVHIPLLLSQE